MNQSRKYLGIISQLVAKKYENGNTYYIGRVESPQIQDRISFHQKALTNRIEINELKEGVFIQFESKFTQTERGERQDAINCSLNCEKTLIKNIIEYDLKTVEFIFEYATDDLKGKLISKIETVQENSPVKEVINKIAELKKALPAIFPISEVRSPEIGQKFKTELNQAEIIPKSFLETIFQLNTPEYNQNLFNVLVEGLKVIDSEDIFQQAKFLLSFNNSIIIDRIDNLNFIFYNKAIDDYKFRLWLEELTEYCSTDIIKTNFEKGTLNLKSDIFLRCHFLDLNNQIKSPNEIEEVYFSGIRAKLLEELHKAKKKILIAVAWFTNDDLFSILCMKLKQDVKVELIIINDYINNWEFGLPFQRFIELGGKLYFSEYPNIMHHKFCVIDNETVFNGSYNWTYFAELRNDENIMLFKGKPNLIKEFKNEFKRLKSKLGQSLKKIIPLGSSQIAKSEKIAFREYFSTDLSLKAQAIRRTNVVYAFNLTKTAIEIDNNNTEAQTLQKEIEPEVLLEQRKLQVQNIVTENTKPLLHENILSKDHANSQTPLKEKVDKVPVTSNTKETITQAKAADSTSFPEDKIDLISRGTATQEQRIPSAPKTDFVQKNGNQAFTPSIPNNISTKSYQINTSPTNNKIAKPIIVENFSVPKSNVKDYLYENLQVVFALDYSNSMEAWQDNGVQKGYKLYSSGKIQKVINMVFAISQGLTSEQDLDMFLFEKKSIRLPKVTKTNFQSYISQEVQKYEMNGTDIFAAVSEINNTYINSSKNVFVILITDGENNEEISNQKIREHFEKNKNPLIFWQFVGLGSNFTFLQSLEKVAANVSFFNLNDVQSISNEILLERLLQKFPKWLKNLKTTSE